MVEIIWTVVWAVVAFVGIAMAVRGASRTWRAAGVAYALGGVGFGTYSVIALTGAFDPPIDFTAADVAAWFGMAGFFAIVAAMLLTLIAIGRTGRRRFLVVFAAATLAIGTYEFWTSNWAARTAPATDRCWDTGHNSGPGKARIERIPPGVWCPDPGGDVFVRADAICWLALVGWTIVWAILASFPIMGLGWAAQQRPKLKPA